MDTIDRKILRFLQKNARITVSEMSIQINLSISALSERLKKMETSGIILQYTTILNPAKLHKELTAIMFISLENPKFTEPFLKFIQQQEDVLECHYLAGEYDYAIKIMTHSTSTLEALLTRIKSVSGIQKTRTNVVLSTLKNTYPILPDLDE